jgi:hypothetical protein
MDSVLQQLREKAAAGGGGGGPGKIDTKQLRAKIEHAIKVGGAGTVWGSCGAYRLSRRWQSWGGGSTH